MQAQRPVAMWGSIHSATALVVVGDVGLGEPVGGEQQLVGAGDLDGHAGRSLTTSRGRLVVAQAEVARMAQAAVARPLGEARSAPTSSGSTQWVPRGIGCTSAKGGSSRSSSRSREPSVAQRVVVEAGADLAGVAQPAVLVVADQQRAEVRARALRRRVAADHQLLLGVALELAPVARAGGAVGAVGALGDDALEALAAGLAEELLAVLVAMRREADRVRRSAARRRSSALRSRSGRSRTSRAVEAQDVEQVEEDRHALARAALEAREARDAAAVERHDLAVDDEVPARLGLERAHEPG